jgi:acetyltransferase-like isoleucine patch superfamily enzyme
MKEFIKIICFRIGWIISFFYYKSITTIFESLLAYIYTGIITRRCKSWGRYANISWGGSITNPQFVFVGNHSVFLRNTCITATPSIPGHDPDIHIGCFCRFGFNNHISAINKIMIGDNVLTGSYVLISDNSHGNSNCDMLNLPPLQRPLLSKGEISIGNNVWIGDKVSILAGVHIGNNAIIGANSVVTKDIPDNCVAVGNPAKVIKTIEI